MSGRRALISVKDLDVSEVRELLALARAFRAARNAGRIPLLLEGRVVANLFFENSTRTRTSFEAAVRSLGGAVQNFSSGGSSISKGESLLDTARTLLVTLRPDALVVRHSSSGVPMDLHRRLGLPVISAGDGFHEHPTQALLDLFTMEDKLGSIEGRKVTIVGDIAHSRVARSNILLLIKMGAQVTACGPGTFVPREIESLGARVEYRLADAICDADAVMALRIQLERQNRMQIPGLSEYAEHWGLNREEVSLMKKSAIILHPGPINRGVEVSPEVADGARAVINDQVENGVLMRMAVLAGLLAPEASREWLGKEGHLV